MTKPQKFLAYQASRARAFGKRRGNTWIKARIWDWEFRTGKWDYLDDGLAQNPLYETVQRFLGGGRLLDVACGTGVVRCALPSHSLTRYVGMDISAAAVSRAEQRTSTLDQLPDGQRFVIGSITDSRTTSLLGTGFDVILFKECINYIDSDHVAALLRHLSDLLSPRGVFCFQIHDRDRWAAHVAAIRDTLRVVEDRPSTKSKSITLVAAPRSRSTHHP